MGKDKFSTFIFILPAIASGMYLLSISCSLIYSNRALSSNNFNLFTQLVRFVIYLFWAPCLEYIILDLVHELNLLHPSQVPALLSESHFLYLAFLQHVF